jgi:hypothetical protein
VYRLLDWNILNNDRRDDRNNMRFLPCRHERTQRKLGRQQLHVQRGDVCGAVRHNFITVRDKRNYGEL